MLRICLVLLLLIHYLLVVGAGLVGRPEPVRQHAQDYVHSADCQQQHYLRLDCFDHCNGEQYEAAKPGQHQSWPQLLSTLKGLDVHCLSAGPRLAGLVFRSGIRTAVTDLVPAIPAGIRATLYAPPRRG
ncbi:MAG: hypothetical protein H7Z21_05675 [Hymenobacter sp.]|nr:hypothetical protein [Hymenobacter sp.]